MANTEEYFPRGGKKPTTTYFKQSGNFLGAAEKGEKKKKKQKRKAQDDDGYLSDDLQQEDFDRSYKNCASRLSYRTIKEGVTILGRVKQVFETKVIIGLPGSMMGMVMACHISEAYNKLLEAYVNDQIDKIIDLPAMFKPGQYVAVKVLEVDGTKLMLSMMPKHVNTGRTHSDIQKGDLYQAAVSSVEDHGYVMDIGIPNTRPFLPKKNANSEIDLEAGTITWCCVKSVSPTAESSIVTLSNDLSTLQKVAPKNNPPLPLLPGTPLFFTVDKPLDNGIEGHVLEDTTAYIQRQHVDKVKGKKPALGQKIKARVLYVIPTRNTPFLSMRDMFASTWPLIADEQRLKDGDVIEEAQVVRILGRTVHFRLGGGCAGTMLVKNIEVHEDLADNQVIAKSYPMGSTHRVRVLSYLPSDFMYAVSDDPSVLRQQYFTMEELNSGDIVNVTVKTIAEDHLLVDVGRLHGYIPQTQYSDAGIFVDPKKASTSKRPRKFKVGQEIKARVLVVDPVKGLLLTLKPSLLDEGLEVLKSYEDVQIGKAYTGFIRSVNEYILVSFFNNVTAIVARHYVTKEPIENLREAFHVGQIVNCTIIKVDPENKKMSGSLTTAPFIPDKSRENKGKRQHKHTDTAEVPHKKQKQDESDKTKKKKKKVTEEDDNQESTDLKKKKKQKSRTESEGSEIIDSETQEKDADRENKKKKKRQKVVEEESDAIETDIHEDSDNVLTPEDLQLIDLSECNNIHKCKKKIVSLLKNVNARTRRIDKIQEKIFKIETKGLNPKNKKFHTAMHMEKLVIEERIKKLLEALNKVQDKLKDFGYDAEEDLRNKEERKVKKVKEKKVIKEVVETEDKKPEKRKKKEKKGAMVVESLEPALEVPSAKEFWSVEENETQNAKEDESSSSDEEEKEQSKKKRKKLSVAEKLSKLRDEEQRVRELEMNSLQSDNQPRSVEQFERALLANPNCSQLWIAFMAFHLQSTELDKARAVSRRALRTVGFREESEKLNIWLAIINCEARFGTKESLKSVIDEALQSNDPFAVHSSLLPIFAETGRRQELSSLVELVLKKYRSVEAVCRCGDAAFKAEDLQLARRALQRALVLLDKKEHVPVIVHFALLERDAGNRERAEALFEQLVAVYPQRVDVVQAYVDMLRKAGDVPLIRQVMERLTSQKLPARKMKILYKKWLEVEEKIGTPEKVDEIKQRAMEYIEKAKF